LEAGLVGWVEEVDGVAFAGSSGGGHD